MVMYAFSIDIMLNYYKFSTLSNTYLLSIGLCWVLCLQSHKAKIKVSTILHSSLGSRENPVPGPFRLLVEFGPMLVSPRSLFPCWISRIPSQLLDTAYIPWPMSPNNFKVSIDRLSPFIALCLSCLFSSHITFASLYFSVGSFFAFTGSWASHPDYTGIPLP